MAIGEISNKSSASNIQTANKNLVFNPIFQGDAGLFLPSNNTPTPELTSFSSDLKSQRNPSTVEGFGSVSESWNPWLIVGGLVIVWLLVK